MSFGKRSILGSRVKKNPKTFYKALEIFVDLKMKNNLEITLNFHKKNTKILLKIPKKTSKILQEKYLMKKN